jgi:hypothetical protein
MAGGAGFGGMRVDVDEPHLDIGDAVRIGRRLGFREQGARSLSAASTISISESSVPGASCATWPMRVFFGSETDACLGPRSPVMTLEQRGLAGAVAADEAGLGARWERNAGVVEKQAAGNAGGNIGNRDHRRRFGRRSAQELVQRPKA